MAGYIGQVNVNGIDYRIGSTLFAILDTATSNQGTITTATTTNSNDTRIFNVPLENFVLTRGVTIHVQFKQTWAGQAGVTVVKLKVGDTDAKIIENPNGAKIWYAGSVVSFTYDGDNYIMNTVGFDASAITIDAGQLTNLSLGNITNEGKLTGHVSSLVVTDSNASITGGAQFGDQTDGTYLNNTGTWSTPDKGVTSITIQTTSPLTGGSSTATTSTGAYTLALVNGYGDTQNPYGTKNKNLVLASSATVNGEAPTFRALVNADIPNTIARIDSPTFTGTPLLTTTPSVGDNSHAIADTAFVINEINQRLSSNDAMLFKGTIGAGGTINTTANPAQTLPTTGYQAGWTYRVITAGTYAGQACEVGDLIIAIHDGPSTGSGVINDDWTIAQTNIDGSIYMGGNSLTSGQLLVADGTNGQIKTSGFSIAQPTAGGILYGTTNAYNVLAAGTNDYVLTMSSGSPVWAAAQHFISHLYVTTQSGTADTSTALDNGAVYLKLYDTSTVRESHKISGAGGATVTTDTSANIIITSKKYKSTGSASAFTGLELGYTTTSAQTETVTANSAAQIGYVNGGILYIKSIKYSTTEVSTGVSEDNT